MNEGSKERILLIFPLTFVLYFLFSIHFLTQGSEKAYGQEKALVEKSEPAGRWCSGPHEIPLQVEVDVFPYIKIEIDESSFTFDSLSSLDSFSLESNIPNKLIYQTLLTNISVSTNTDVVLDFEGVDDLVPKEGRDSKIEVAYGLNGDYYPAADLNNESIEITKEKLVEGNYKLSLHLKIMLGFLDSKGLWYWDPDGFTVTIVPKDSI
jgi:hypothetical protein